MITRCIEAANSLTVAMQLVRSEKVERREFLRIRLEAKVRYARITEPDDSARVQRSQPEPELYGKSDIGIKFIDIRQNECNLVMSLVFRLQLKFQRQKAVSSS